MRFVYPKGSRKALTFSYEFGHSRDWSVMERFVERMAGREDIWYAANLEIYTYLQAVRTQEFSADGTIMHNPAAVSVWVCTKDGLIEVKSGETKKLEKGCDSRPQQRDILLPPAEAGKGGSR